MATLDDREKADENKYAHDRELEFRIHARRNKLLGLWAAAKMGLAGAAAEDYAKTAALADFGHTSEDGVFAKVKHDLIAKGVDVSDHDIREEMYRLLHLVKQQTMEG